MASQHRPPCLAPRRGPRQAIFERDEDLQRIFASPDGLSTEALTMERYAVPGQRWIFWVDPPVGGEAGDARRSRWRGEAILSMRSWGILGDLRPSWDERSWRILEIG
eukprot:Skav213058  [mRNA]  locus=scaffold364:357129:357449:- [translate_table: standard]